MTEQEYIDCQDMGKLDAVVQILTTIEAENSSIIPKIKFDDILASLWSWRDKLRKVCEIRG